MNGFAIGDHVTWTSQSKGYTTTKHGVVVAVVPAEKDAHNCIPFGYCCRSSCGFGSPRRHESYLIRVGKSRRLYWPVVSILKKKA